MAMYTAFFSYFVRICTYRARIAASIDRAACAKKQNGRYTRSGRSPEIYPERACDDARPSAARRHADVCKRDSRLRGFCGTCEAKVCGGKIISCIR